MQRFLVHLLLVTHGVLLEPAEPLQGVLDLPWQTELCCDSPKAPIRQGGGRDVQVPTTGNQSESESPRSPQCFFKNATCRDPDQDHHSNAISLQRLGSRLDKDTIRRDWTDPIRCAGEDSFVCFMALEAGDQVVMVTADVTSGAASCALLRLPPLPVKPSPPVNVSHSQTTEGELILSWALSPHTGSHTGPIRYQVRYSYNSSHPSWQSVLVSGEPKLALDVMPSLKYTVQVRCSSLALPDLWSNWSRPHHISLFAVTYIPKTLVVRPGENVTVYCVLNEPGASASAAAWWINFNSRLPPDQCAVINDRVSRVTVQPSDKRMSDILQCLQPPGEESHIAIPYAQIFMEGAAIDINCETDGDLQAMTCQWNNSQWAKSSLLSRRCGAADRTDRVGEEAGWAREEKCQVRQQGAVRSCTFQPLWMYCYTLWLEVQTQVGPVRSRAVNVVPMDHVKPHPPSPVKALTLPRGVLRVTWVPPILPAGGLQFQVRYYSPSTLKAQPEWKVQGPFHVNWAEFAVPDMCGRYIVQVRCMHTNGTGYWSEWTESAYSTPLNSRAPDQGPDFWRVLQEDPAKNQTSVTLLFKPLPLVERSYCVDGLVVQHQTPGGTVTTENIGWVSSHRFEWPEEVHTVTVKSFNSLGSSSRNLNVTLGRRPHRQGVRWFRASVVNSTHVALSWSLLEHKMNPLSLVVMWTARASSSPEPQGKDSWVRIPSSERTFYLRGDFYESEEYWFTLYPVFADGEGEPVHTIATRTDPAAYLLLLIITFLSIVIFVTLALSQNHMKKFMWKDVPNPSDCSWAQDVDFKKVDHRDHLFGLPEGQPAWPLLLVSEAISEAVIVEKTEPPSPDPGPGLENSTPRYSEGCLIRPPSPAPFESSSPGPLDNQLGEAPDLHGMAEGSGQSSVTYATVLLAERPRLLYKQDGSGSSSSDEGNFSANNSDISGSIPGGLWDLENSNSNPLRSCSYNSIEEFSEGSEQGNEGIKEEREKDMYYLEVGCQGEEDDEEEEEEEEEKEGDEEESQIHLLKDVVLNIENCSVESMHGYGEPSTFGMTCDMASRPTFTESPLYLPQFQTAHSPMRMEDLKEPPDCCLSESFTSPTCTLGVDLRRGRRRFSGNLQLPPLSWRQAERSRTPDDDLVARPTTLPFGAPPRIDITPVDPEGLCEAVALI
ncbi:leptin receptor [Aplochiton taeniatus]